MEELLKQFGVLGQYVDLMVVTGIFVIVQYFKKVFSIIKKILKLNIEIPHETYPILSVVVGVVLSFVKELNITLIAGVCSGVFVTIAYDILSKAFESVGLSKLK